MPMVPKGLIPAVNGGVIKGEVQKWVRGRPGRKKRSLETFAFLNHNMLEYGFLYTGEYMEAYLN